MKNDSADKWRKTEIRMRGKEGGTVKLKAFSTVVKVITASLLESQPGATKALMILSFSVDAESSLSWLV